MSASQALTLTGALDAEYVLAQPLPITAEWRDEYVTITAPAIGLRAMGQSSIGTPDSVASAAISRAAVTAARARKRITMPCGSTWRCSLPDPRLCYNPADLRATSGYSETTAKPEGEKE